MATPQENLLPQDFVDEREFARRFRLLDDATLARELKARVPEYGRIPDADLSRRIKGLDDGALTRGMLQVAPEYRSRVRLSFEAQRPSVSSAVNEDVDFTAPVQTAGVPDFKPLEFKAFDETDLSLPARMAVGAARFGGAQTTAPLSSPLLRGKRVKAVVKSDGRSYPSPDELSDATLRALGAESLGQRYRAETGRALLMPTVSTEEVKQSYDPQARTYSFEVSPTHADIRILNAYGQGGLQAALEESDRIQGELRAEDERYIRERDAGREFMRRMGLDPDEVSGGNGPIAKGIGDAGIGLARIINNASALGGKDAGAAARDAQFIESAAASIPEEKTGFGRVVRGVSGLAARTPQFMVAGPAAAPYVAASSVALENVHRGPERAIKEGLKVGALGGVARGAGVATQGLSPVARQVAARNVAGATNVLTDKLTGNNRSVLESYAEGALMPVGRSRGVERSRFARPRVLSETGELPPVVTGARCGDDVATAERVGDLVESQLATPSATRPVLVRRSSGNLSVVVETPQGKARVELKPETPRPAQYRHARFGLLTATANQRGVPRGHVRTVDEAGQTRTIQRPNGRGQGNVLAIPEPRHRMTPLERVVDVANIPRSFESSGDVSALGRQGLVLFVLHPAKGARAFARSIPALFSESHADKILNDIHTSPLAPVRKEAGLYLSDYHKSGRPLTHGEEMFQSSAAQKIPIAGPIIRGSERGFVTFLDKLRADVFDDYATTHPKATPADLRGIADVINKFSGRGSLGRWGEKHALALSQAFYSPRFQLSRAQSLALPLTAETAAARRYAARELVKLVGAGVSMMGLAKAAGYEVGTNPLSSDFGKIRLGHTRVDLWGGFAPLARYTAQIIAGKATELESGETVPRSRLTTALRFLRSKAAPQISIPLDSFIGTDIKGEPATFANLPKRALMPLAWRDVEDAIADDLQQGGSGLQGALKGALGLTGAGVNTIRPQTPEERIQQEVMRLKAKPEAKGMMGAQVGHNARVNVEVRRLLKVVDDDTSLSDAERDELRHAVDSRFYWGRVRGANDRRELSAIERVFNERLKGAEEDLRRRIEAIKGQR